MFLLFFGVVGGSRNAIGRIFISTACNYFINWALIVVSAIKRSLCARWFFAKAQKESGQSLALNAFPILHQLAEEEFEHGQDFRPQGY
jgi:hypothetical protein